jgi:hypothetical protein
MTLEIVALVGFLVSGSVLSALGLSWAWRISAGLAVVVLVGVHLQRRRREGKGG